MVHFGQGTPGGRDCLSKALGLSIEGEEVLAQAEKFQAEY